MFLHKKKLPVKAIGVAAAAVLLLGGAVVFTNSTAKGVDEESLKNLDQRLRDAAVTCYALEGTYPPDLAYLYAHYALPPEENRYVVYYTFVADNLMPDITVLAADEEATP